jgi:rare lipoprotein A
MYCELQFRDLSHLNFTKMLILGLMWVASWFSGVPNFGTKLLETPKFLTHVLCNSRVCHSTVLPSSSLQPLVLGTSQHSASIFLDRSEVSSQNNWLSTIESLLFNSEAAPDIDTIHPVTQFIDAMQSVFNQLPVVAESHQADTSVAIVEVGYDGTVLSQNRPILPKLGFWQCPTWQVTTSDPISGGYQIWLKGCQVATVLDRSTADLFSQKLRQVMTTPNLNASDLRAGIELGQPSLKLGDRTIFTVSQQLASQMGRPAELIAIEWANNLRIALGQSSLSLADAQAQMYGLEPTHQNIGGMASWYGPYFHGRQTANGEIFNQNDLTAAHPTLPLGTFLRVTNQLNGKSIVVRVNDRGPYFDNRVLDLSKNAASLINGEEKGVVPIEAVVMQSAVVAQTSPKKPPQQVARLVTGY